MSGKLDLTERLAAIVTAQEEIASLRLDPDAVMGVVANRVMELTGADGVVIEMVREEEIHYHTTVGSLEPHTGTVFDIEGSLSGESVRSRRVLISDDTDRDPRVNTDISSLTGSKSLIVVPLIHQDEVTGVLKVVSVRRRSFDDLDIYSLQLMAGFIAASLAQAERYRAEIASEKRFRMLFDRNLAGAFFTTPEGEVAEVNDALVRLLGFASKEDALGDKVWNRYEKESDRKHLLDLLRKEKTLTRHPLRLRRKDDGRTLDVVMNVDLVHGPGRTYLIGTMLEVTGDEVPDPDTSHDDES